MDMGRLENKNFLLKQDGQTTVEYLLLFAVVISLVTVVLKSNAFKGIFGEEGTFAKQFREQIEFNYRHGVSGKGLIPETINFDNHESYLQAGGSTRFFGPKDVYPKR